MDLKPGKKWRWQCSKCSKTCRTFKKLTRHMVRHDSNAKVKYEDCGKIHTNRGRPSCDTCHRTFSSFTALRRHIYALHSTMDRPRFPCMVPGCEKSYQNKRNVVRHLKTEHAENPVRYPLTPCGNEFKTRQYLGPHIATHKTEKTYNCATCGRSFARMHYWKLHEMAHLEKSTLDRLQCPVCPQTFSSRRATQHHSRVVHENQRNYPCALCDKRFSRSTILKCHVEAIHVTNKELIHSCDKCEYKSYSKSNLATHRRRHDATRHECYFCGKKFATFSELVRHCRVHTQEKLKYLCM